MATFNSAFKEARDAGRRTFAYNGKNYTTRKKGESEEAWTKGIAERRKGAGAKSSDNKSETKPSAISGANRPKSRGSEADSANRVGLAQRQKRAEPDDGAKKTSDNGAPEHTATRPKTRDDRPTERLHRSTMRANAEREKAAEASSKSSESFSSAFAAASKAGKKSFEWRGKQYSTKKRNA